MNKNIKLFLYCILFFGFFVLAAALSIAVAKTKNENKELKRNYSSTLAAQSKEAKKKEKILLDRKEAAELVKSFIPVFFLADKANYAENRKKIEDMVSAELYEQVKGEEFGISEYEVKIVSAPVYELIEDGQANRYHFCSIINLRYMEGTVDYGTHMQIWDFTCGYDDGKMRILSMEQQNYIE